MLIVPGSQGRPENYMDANGRGVRPVMIHHAVLGSVGRLIGMLLELYCLFPDSRADAV